VDRLAMGSALRITFRFRELPWMTLPRRRADGSLDRLSFLRTETGPFRVWWTAYPAEFPLVVAWSGGPAATLARGDPGEVADRALRGLARDLGTSQGRLDSLVEGYWTHDWDGDPLASGAYAYARVGGAEASALLARPVRRTLFFAGEATDGSQLGTVEGAIASGRRAARLVDLALRRE
jgi:monoamine oxidase